MTEHTPGPWKAVYVGCGDWDLSGPVTQEDWTLAAAAPDLLAMLIEAANFIQPYSVGQELLERIDGAIAKATGEQA